MRVSLLVACTTLALASCSAMPVREAAAPVRAAAVEATTASAMANDNLNAVAWVQTSVEYRAISEQTFRAAAEQLDVALAQANWDALVSAERGNPAAGLKPAVIMDVDETVLDNSPYQARLVRDGAQYDEATWAQWVAEKKARPLPGVVDFARAASAKGVTLLYVSNRAVELKEATLANLRQVGLPVADDSVFLGLGMVVEGCEQRGSDKNCRRRLAGEKYRVLLQFGDQMGDFVEVQTNTVEGRAQLFEEYDDWFGERWWMLPNPTYGSWEPALFDNQWGSPAAERRRSKLDALDYAP